MTAEEKLNHERTGHATFDKRCEACVQVRGVSRHVKRACDETVYLDYAVIKNSKQGSEVKVLVGAGPRGEMYARAVHRKGARLEDVGSFLKVIRDRYGQIEVMCDQEECLREVVHSFANNCACQRASPRRAKPSQWPRRAAGAHYPRASAADGAGLSTPGC